MNIRPNNLSTRRNNEDTRVLQVAGTFDLSKELTMFNPFDLSPKTVDLSPYSRLVERRHVESRPFDLSNSTSRLRHADSVYHRLKRNAPYRPSCEKITSPQNQKYITYSTVVRERPSRSAAARDNTYKKFCEVRTCGFRDTRADRQTNRHANRNTSHCLHGAK